MTTAFSAALLALQLLGSGERAQALPDAYLDPGARILVAEARERRAAMEGRIERYSTVSRSRVTVGFRALRRNRILYRCEAAARVKWERGDTIRVELLASREAVPMVDGEPRAGDGDCGGGSFDPTAERLGLAFGGGMSMSDSTFLRHPLAPGSERDYRFRSGGSTAMRLADGSLIRLLELEVLPRRSDPTLVSGSLWLEDRSHAVVRAILRMARPFDYDRDRHRLEDDEDDDDDDVPRILRPLRAEMRYMTIEYGLWEQQWWLPRLIAFEGEAEAGRLLGVPVRMERTYGEYRVESAPMDRPLPPLSPLPADSVCGRGVTGNGGEDGEDGHDHRHGCSCVEGRCQVVVTYAVVDSLELVHSDYLPPSIYTEGPAFIAEREMEEILGRVDAIRRPPWQVAPVTWRTGLQGLDLVRYNRVEGLSVGAAANMHLGRATLDATVRLGVADLAPNFELAASRTAAFSTQRLAVYRRLEAVGPGSSGPGASLSALLFGRDEAEYFRSWGVELRRRPSTGAEGLTWRIFGELQRAAAKNTDFSMAHLLGGSGFRSNLRAAVAEQIGAEVGVRADRGSDPAGWRGWISAAALGSTGSYSFLQPALQVGGSAPLPRSLRMGIELNGATTLGHAPLQSWYFLGGGGTVRGYGGNAARGESYWTGRTELATAGPAVRLVIFGDAGWAGPRRGFTVDPPLLSAGVGVSFLDGLVRVDAALPLREAAGYDSWRVEMQVDAGL